MLPHLYYALFSPPSRACLVTSKLIGLNLNLQPVDFSKREHFSEEFLKLNPQHTIPVLVDEGNVMWDSHAIMIYMLTKYAKDSSFYPTNAFTRARINQRLFFDSGILFPAIKDFVVRIVYGGQTEYNQKSVQQTHTGYECLETFLEDNFVVGNNMTIGDVSIYTTIISLDRVVPIEQEKYPRINAWMKRMETLPDNKEINEKGSLELFNRIATGLEQNRLRSK